MAQNQSADGQGERREVGQSLVVRELEGLDVRAQVEEDRRERGRNTGQGEMAEVRGAGVGRDEKVMVLHRDTL